MTNTPPHHGGFLPLLLWVFIRDALDKEHPRKNPNALDSGNHVREVCTPRGNVGGVLGMA